MIPLFGDSMADGMRWAVEGRLIAVATQALRRGVSIVLDFGLWSRDERSALRSLAQSVGAACAVVYLPIDREVQLARIAHRQATTPWQTFPMSEADVDGRREISRSPTLPNCARRRHSRLPARLVRLAGMGCGTLADLHRQLTAHGSIR